MASYNIIYTSPRYYHYLWNGAGFDQLDKSDLENLHFSGKTYLQNDLPGELQKCREVISKTFPDDKEPQLEAMEIGVGTNKKE